MIRWLFFDVGNVLLIDEPLSAMRWMVLHDIVRAAGHRLEFEDLMTKRETLVLKNRDGTPHITLAFELLGERGWADVRKQIQEKVQQDFMAYNFLMEGIKDVLYQLSSKYDLALAANQPRQVSRQAMKDIGLLDFFKIVGISEEMGLHKPDPQFFKSLLSEAGCTPSEAIMIGDRIDNDIAPAQKLGMQTVWFNLSPEAQGYVARNEFEKLYVDSLHRAPSYGIGIGNEQIKPSATVTHLNHLVDAVEKLAREK